MIEVTMEQWEYDVLSCKIMFSDETIDIDKDKVGDILIEADFDNDYFPVFSLTLQMNDETYNRMIKEKTSAKIRLKLSKHTVNETDGETGVEQTVFNKLFTYVMEEDTPDLTVSSKELVDTESDDSSSVMSEFNQYTFFLYSYDDLKKSAIAVNDVITSGSMNTAVAYVLSIAGYEKLLLEKSDNTKTYSEILIPPLTVQGALLYLQEYYGIFKTGMTYFHGLDKTYVIAQSEKCNVFAKNEYKKTVINVLKSVNSASLETGTYTDTEKKTYFINALPQAIEIQNLSLVRNLTDGNVIVATNPFTGKTTTVKPKTKQIDEGSKRFMMDKSLSGYTVSTEKYEISENSYQITLQTSKFDITAFTPNKVFQFAFEDKSINKTYGGNYRLISYVVQIKDSTVVGTFIFRKKPA